MVLLAADAGVVIFFKCEIRKDKIKKDKCKTTKDKKTKYKINIARGTTDPGYSV